MSALHSRDLNLTLSSEKQIRYITFLLFLHKKCQIVSHCYACYDVHFCQEVSKSTQKSKQTSAVRLCYSLKGHKSP